MQNAHVKRLPITMSLNSNESHVVRTEEPAAYDYNDTHGNSLLKPETELHLWDE